MVILLTNYFLSNIIQIQTQNPGVSGVQSDCRVTGHRGSVEALKQTRLLPGLLVVLGKLTVRPIGEDNAYITH